MEVFDVGTGHLEKRVPAMHVMLALLEVPATDEVVETDLVALDSAACQDVGASTADEFSGWRYWMVFAELAWTASTVSGSGSDAGADEKGHCVFDVGMAVSVAASWKALADAMLIHWIVVADERPVVLQAALTALLEWRLMLSHLQVR